MKMTFRDEDQMSVVTLQGDLTVDDVDMFTGKMTNYLSEHKVRDFVLDVHEMEFIDSVGLEKLLWLQEQCSEQLGQIRLVGVTDNVDTILRVTRLSKQLEQHDNIAEAINSLK